MADKIEIDLSTIRKIDLTLPLLNVIDMDEDSVTNRPLKVATKNFFESDVAIVSSIFSQTIQSTTVTPTDDDQIDRFIDFVDLSISETLDGYNEPGMHSFTDTIITYDDERQSDESDDLVQQKTSMTTTTYSTVEQSETVRKQTSIDRTESEDVEAVKVKKTKKSKRTEIDKENQSVVSNCQNVTDVTLHNELNERLSNGIEDDLSFIDVKRLKNFFAAKSNRTASETLPKRYRQSNKLNGRYAKSWDRDLDALTFATKGVSVKQLCRSFGDLTAVGVDRYDHSRYLHHAKSVSDLWRFEHLPIQTGISVRNLRDNFVKSIDYLDGTTVKSTRKISLTVKQFDMRQSFSKFDALQKKNSILHVRSSDAGKAQEKFNGNGDVEIERNCRTCKMAVYKMEEMKAERNIYHRRCFKCSECGRALGVDNYESHEGVLYCKPHFKALFAPKAVEESEPAPPRKLEMIIRENQPIELPPDVVRSSDKTDLGLDELHQLNVKSRYQVFEKSVDSTDVQQTKEPPTAVKRSPSIISKLAKFQAKGMNVGVTDEALIYVPDESESEPEEEEDDFDYERAAERGEDVDLIRAKRAQRERPISFANMSDIKSRFESGHALTREERRQERKQEIQSIRSKLFMGKQAKIKEMYQQAVLDSEQSVHKQREEVDIGDKAKSIKDRFEKGDIYRREDPRQEEDMAVFEQGIAKQSRSIFMEIDANAAKTPTGQPLNGARTPEPKRNQVSTEWPPMNKTVHFTEQRQDTVDIGDKAKSIKDRFETGDIYRRDESNKGELNVEAAIAKQSRSHFMEIDANASKPPTVPPLDGAVNRKQPIFGDGDVIKSGEKLDDVKVETAEISSKFKFFETYQPKKNEKKEFRITPPRDGVVKLPTPDVEEPALGPNGEPLDIDETTVAVLSHTATKMLSRFREMEEKTNEQQQFDGLKPLKQFTPPPDAGRRTVPDRESDDDVTDSEEDSEDEEDRKDRYVDESLQQAQAAARARQLRAKFERWETKEIERTNNNSSVALYDDQPEDASESQVESAKSIRAKFESMRNGQSSISARERIKVNRFV